jgi:hypothetical protein
MKIRMIHCPKAADLELPATDPANAPVPCRIQTGHLPAGSSPFARNADANACNTEAQKRALMKIPSLEEYEQQAT